MLALIALFSPVSALADSTFSVTGSFGSGAYNFAPGSTITINTTTGLVTASSISITGLQDVFASVPDTANFAQSIPVQSAIYQWMGSLGEFLDIQCSGAGCSPGWGGTERGLLFVYGTSPSGGITENQYNTSVTLTPVVTTPEPSSFLLFGVGLVGLMAIAVLRRN